MDFHYVGEGEPQHDIDEAIEFIENKKIPTEALRNLYIIHFRPGKLPWKP